MTLQRKVALVDLGSGNSEVKEIPQPLLEKYVGGRGIDMYLLSQMLGPGLDPWDAGNLFLIGAGLLAGAPAPLAAGMIHVGGKLPLTGVAGSLAMGGFLGAELRFAGFGHVVIRGMAAHPVYLWIHNGQVGIEDATPFWDADSLDAQIIIRNLLGEGNAQVMAVSARGPDILSSTDLRTDGKHCRKASEFGMLMRSKNLKAVAVRGPVGIEAAVALSRRGLSV